MGRGWAEEKQIGEELQREGPRTGRWRLEQERVGRLRVIGRQSETRSRLWERVLECRRHLGKEEVFKVEGERREEKWDAVKAELIGKFIVLNTYIGKEEGFKINDLGFPLRTLRK